MIPSYDDLTPGIPDVIDSETVDQLTLFLAKASTSNATTPNSTTPSAHSGTYAVTSTASGLYACLRLTAKGQPQTADRAPQTANGALQTANCQLPTLLAIARDFSPRVMRASDCEVLVDVSGLGRLIGEPPEIARQLARAMYDAGLTASVAIAPMQTMARVLATQLPDYPIARFHELSVNYLRPLETLPPGINHRDRARPYEIFEKWGIATLGELAALPADDLSSRLGRRGVALQQLACGRDPRPFVPDAETPRYIGRLELEWPLDTLEPLSFVFARLLEPLSLALERADRGAAAIRLELRLVDRTVCSRLLQLPAAMRDPRVLRTLLLLDLESHPPTEAVDIVTIELDPAPARITQFSLLQRALPSPETLSTLTARLSALIGDARIGSPVLVDSHAPDAFTMTRYAPEGANGAKGALGANGAGAEGANGADGVGAGSALVLRRQRQPVAIRVSLEHGRAVHIALSKRGLPHGAVVEAAGPWRSSGNWWTDGWNRDEWDVALASGAVCRIYLDRATERWFLEGIYD
jgi:protein ImuB